MQIARCMKTQHGTIPVACGKVRGSVYKLFNVNIVLLYSCQTLVPDHSADPAIFVVCICFSNIALQVNSMEFNEGQCVKNVPFCFCYMAYMTQRKPKYNLEHAWMSH